RGGSLAFLVISRLICRSHSAKVELISYANYIKGNRTKTTVQQKFNQYFEYSPQQNMTTGWVLLLIHMPIYKNCG
ncbi:hypothetical protein, partial [uncultured Metabacillus sp.]